MFCVWRQAFKIKGLVVGGFESWFRGLCLRGLEFRKVGVQKLTVDVAGFADAYFKPFVSIRKPLCSRTV